MNETPLEATIRVLVDIQHTIETAEQDPNLKVDDLVDEVIETIADLNAIPLIYSMMSRIEEEYMISLDGIEESFEDDV